MLSWRLAGIILTAALLAIAAGLGAYFILVGGGDAPILVTQLPRQEMPQPAAGSSPRIPLPRPAPPHSATAPVPQPVPETIGSWQLHCVLDLRSHEACRAEQILTGPDGQSLLGVTIRPPLAQSPAKLSVTPPWGIRISAGVAGRVDSLPAFEMPVVFCQATGCHAETDLSDALSQALQTGTNLHLVMIAAEGEIVRATVPLAGFAQAHRRMVERANR
jgi:invasion protein IalB